MNATVHCRLPRHRSYMYHHVLFKVEISFSRPLSLSLSLSLSVALSLSLSLSLSVQGLSCLVILIKHTLCEYVTVVHLVQSFCG